MESEALVSIGEPDVGAGVGCSLGLGAATARGAGDSSSVAAGFAEVGFGVLSGSATGLTFFLPDFLLPDLALLSAFFFLPFAVVEGLFDLFADGVGRRLALPSSSSLDFEAAPAGDFVGLGVGDSSSSSS